MPEQDRDVRDVHAFQEELHGKGVAEAVGVAVRHVRPLTNLPERALP